MKKATLPFSARRNRLRKALKKGTITRHQFIEKSARRALAKANFFAKDEENVFLSLLRGKNRIFGKK